MAAFISSSIEKNNEADLRAETSDAVAAYRAQLEHAIATNLALTASLKSYIAVNPDITQERYATFAADLLSYRNHIRNIGAAKDLIITHMYPVEGNERAIGVAYKDIPDQYQAVQEALEANQIILAGPVNLVQGGNSIIARLPVYYAGTDKPWGVVSVVIDSDALFRDMTYDTDRWNIAIKGKDAKGAAGETVHGDMEAFTDARAVTSTMLLPYGSWQIAGVSREAPSTLWHRTGLFLAFLFVTMVTYMFVRNQERYTQNLQAEREHAQQANEAKSIFLSNMTHELRTPLTGVIGMLDLVTRTNLTSEQENILSTARHSATLLMNIINDILDISKLEAGKKTLDYSSESPIKVTQNVHEILSAFAQKHSVKLILDFDDCSLRDSQRLKLPVQAITQILMNLVNNAIKFSQNGTVRIRLSCTTLADTGDDISLQWQIIDTGIGIPSKDLDRIFDRFEQEDASTTKSIQGTGLGLAICKQLTDLIGGSLSVESVHGHGSVFILSAAFKPAAGEQAPTNDAPTINPAPRLRPAMDSKPLEGLTILFADDNQTNRFLVKTLLQHNGANYFEAENGQECIDVWRHNREHIDLILMDISMPVMNGITATQKIQAEATSLGEKAPPILALTANSLQSDIDSYLQNGLDGYIGKPINPEQMNETILAFLTKSNDNGSAPERQIPPYQADVSLLQEPVNAETLATLRQVVGTEFGTIIRSYKTYIEENTPKILTAGHEKDTVQLAECAHSFKSCSLQLGAEHLAELAVQIEQYANAGDLDKTIPILSEFEQEALRVQAYLREHFPTA
ncbi:hypothetical protein GCM10017044_02760 [Kordiimonas sediminis]|uniref:histidine kinase n=1 Tax=Kordiimonas sediminis TaxID=1735581 RepID=A0A919AM02_9PROT|nr:ATP-binding protein [Kordiimonas sediminis]GHF12279.1 hypothetical protein GCM10017044_02760 [Kordiimonas sediminis]